MNYLLTAVLCLLVCFTAARAEAPPACTGTDLAAKLKAEDPAAYDAVMAEAKAIPNGEAIFWKIERDGLPISHLLGTAHVTDPRITTLSPLIEAALHGTAALALELSEVGDQQHETLAMFGLAKYMMLPQGQTIWDLIPDEDEHLLRDNPNLPPGAINGMFGYQPWVVAVTVSRPLCETARNLAGIRALDAQLAVEARALDIPVHGLETMEEQISILAGLPMDQQLAYLMAVTRNAASLPDQFETLVSLYVQRRVTVMMPLMLKVQPLKPEESKMLEFVERELVIRRNHRMAERALPLLAKGNLFIAVGTLHLPGKEGVVELLRQAGYKLTPIN